MLETLAGRLKCERTEDGIRIRIPTARFTLRFLFGYYLIPSACILSIYLIAKGWSVLSLHFHPHPHPHQMTWWAVFFDGLLSAIALTAGSVFARVTARTSLTLNPAEMKIEYRSAGIKRATRVYATANVSNLRLVMYSPGENLHNHFRMNEIQYCANSRVESFASGITEREAEALIARMMEVYPFPKS